MATTFAMKADSVHLSVQRGDELQRAQGLERDGSTFAWLRALQEGLGHEPYVIQAIDGSGRSGYLPLALVSGPLFGRFLVSLPYVNQAGLQSVPDDDLARRLIDRAVELADELKVRYLELRHDREIAHPALGISNHAKVLMQLRLPATADLLWDSFKSKLRSQIKAGLKRDFEVRWGGVELLDRFYEVFAENMRDLGTPVYSRQLFAAILRHFGDRAELCVVGRDGQPWAGALLIHHGDGRSEVPSASSLRRYNDSSVNMVMYWQLLSRAIERKQTTFDFGRSSEGSGTYRFKQQWGAQPKPSVWQYYLRHGSVSDMRPDNSRFSLAIRTWQRLPVWVTRLIGPTIVRGIP